MIDNKKILFNLPKIVGDELRNLKNLSKLKHF